MSEEREIPKGWSYAKVIDLADVLMGQSPPSETYNDERIGLPFFQGKAEFTDLYPVVRKWCNVSTKIAEPNDILMSVRAPVGSTNIANIQCCIGRGLAAIRYTHCYKYLFYHFRLIANELDKKGTGTTFRAISGDVLKNTEIPISPLSEQQRIVAKIEELFSSLDKGIESLKTAQAQLKVYRQSVLKWAFEGKLTNENVKEGELPKGWEEKSLGNVIKTIDGDRGSNYPKKNEFFADEFCLFLSTKNVREDRFVFDENIFITKEKDAVLRGGKLILNDVVITTRGTLGNVALYTERIPYKNVRINSGMLILRITDEKLDFTYLMKFISSPIFGKQLKEKQSGTAQPQIPANVLRGIIIPIPPKISEQNRIVDEIESRLSVCDKIEESISTSLLQAEALRQSILKKAFEGKLVAQDPNDEPASILLERIKAEREMNKPVKKVKEKKVKLKNDILVNG
jgi:type I restriction enzyme, S subunit